MKEQVLSVTMVLRATDGGTDVVKQRVDEARKKEPPSRSSAVELD